ncbi:MAG TPA: hypothetical protein RMH99_25950, partial [Sandaracinaceae bacterium LLY-WYZ-13_1]|nr:hypothetical protein [Sandaracinaceae bacterium LLY-WYZ-13_1]
PEPSRPCRSYGACDEATDSFPLTVLGAGASCDDGLSCTTGDVCRTEGGICAGTALATCPGGSECSGTTPLGAGPFDVPVARLSGTVTVDGAPLPSVLSETTNGFSVFLVHRQTGQRHYVSSPQYTDFGTELVAGSDAVDAVLVPGVYDVVFSRGHNDGSLSFWPYVNRQDAPSELPNGYVVLREGVVLGAGPQTLNVDVPMSHVSGPVTVDGWPLPDVLTDTTNGFSLFLVSSETEQRHYASSPQYTSFGTELVAGSDAVDAVLVPGVYDVVFSRGHNDGSDGFWPYVNRQDAPSELPNGYARLRSCVLVE